MKTPLILLLAIAICSSCSRHSFYQRKYRPGIFHERFGPVKEPQAESGSKKSSATLESLKTVEEIQSRFTKVTAAETSGCPDTIITKDGRRLNAKVLLVTESFVRYASCEGEELKNMNLSSIRSIHYKSGLKEKYSVEADLPGDDFPKKHAYSRSNEEQASSKVNMPAEKKKRRGEKFATFGLICGLLGGLLLAIAAPIGGLILAGLTLLMLILLQLDHKDKKRRGDKIIIVIGCIMGGFVMAFITVFLIIMAVLFATFGL